MEHICWDSAIPGGGRIDIPITATDGTLEHMITLREGLSMLYTIYVAASIHER
jgi:hypothetical protein